MTPAVLQALAQIDQLATEMAGTADRGPVHPNAAAIHAQTDRVRAGWQVEASVRGEILRWPEPIRVLSRVVLVLVLGSYLAISAQIAPAWTSNTALWARTALAAPTDPRAALNHGSAQAVDGAWPLAVAEWERSWQLLQLRPLTPRDRVTRAVADQNLGAWASAHADGSLAATYFQDALQTWPEGFRPDAPLYHALSVAAVPSPGATR